MGENRMKVSARVQWPCLTLPDSLTSIGALGGRGAPGGTVRRAAVRKRGSGSVSLR